MREIVVNVKAAFKIRLFFGCNQAWVRDSLCFSETPLLVQSKNRDIVNKDTSTMWKRERYWFINKVRSKIRASVIWDIILIETVFLFIFILL